MKTFADYERLLPQVEENSFYVWGTGNTAQLYQEGIKREYINILGYIDNNQDKWGQEFNGKLILSPAQYKEKMDAPVLICTAQKNVLQAVSEQISSVGGCSYNFDTVIFAKHKEELRKVYEMLDDRKSQDIFLEVLCHRLTWEQMEDEQVADKQYFAVRDFHTYRNDDVFVACGAFVGDSIEQYIWQMHGVFKKIFAFEIDRENIKRLKKRTERLIEEWNISDGSIEICPYGINDKNTELFVSHYSNNHGLGSKISKEAISDAESIKMVSLDAFFAHRQDKVTFIKADIESFEYKMLLGAKKIIEEYKPRIAVCIYHNPTDIYSIPLLLKKINADYKFAVRQHSYDVDETVLYAYL